LLHRGSIKHACSGRTRTARIQTLVTRRSLRSRRGLHRNRSSRLWEEGRNRLFLVHTLDGRSNHTSNTQNSELGTALLVTLLTDGVSDDQLIDSSTLLDVLTGHRGQDTVSDAHSDSLGTSLLQHTTCLDESTSSVDHIVNDDAVVALHITSHLHALDFAGFDTALENRDDGSGTNLIGKDIGAFDTTSIRRDDNSLIRVVPRLGLDVGGEDRSRHQVVERHVAEEALDLAAVKVHGEDAVGAHRLDELGHDRSGDGNAGVDLTILAGVRKHGNDGGDTAGRGSAECVNHEEQLHQGGVDVEVLSAVGGLDDEDVIATDVLADFDVDFSVVEAGDGGLAEFGAEEAGDVAGEFGVGTAGDETEAVGDFDGHHG